LIPYKHEPFTDFSKEENKKAMQEGYKVVDAYLGNDFPLIVGGERITTEAKIKSYNPAKKEELVGAVSKATQEIASKAMDIADKHSKLGKKLSLKYVQTFFSKQQLSFVVVNLSSLLYYQEKRVKLGLKLM